MSWRIVASAAPQPLLAHTCAFAFPHSCWRAGRGQCTVQVLPKETFIFSSIIIIIIIPTLSIPCHSWIRAHNSFNFTSKLNSFVVGILCVCVRMWVQSKIGFHSSHRIESTPTILKYPYCEWIKRGWQKCLKSTHRDPPRTKAAAAASTGRQAEQNSTPAIYHPMSESFFNNSPSIPRIINKFKQRWGGGGRKHDSYDHLKWISEESKVFTFKGPKSV